MLAANLGTAVLHPDEQFGGPLWAYYNNMIWVALNNWHAHEKGQVRHARLPVVIAVDAARVEDGDEGIDLKVRRRQIAMATGEGRVRQTERSTVSVRTHGVTLNTKLPANA